jgi:hypothetical protein
VNAKTLQRVERTAPVRLPMPLSPDRGHLLDARLEADRACREHHRARLVCRLQRSGSAYLWWDRCFSRAGVVSFGLAVLGVVLAEIRHTTTEEAYFTNAWTGLPFLAGIAGLAVSALCWIGISALYHSHDGALRAYARRYALDLDEVETPFHP